MPRHAPCARCPARCPGTRCRQGRRWSQTAASQPRGGRSRRRTLRSAPCGGAPPAWWPGRKRPPTTAAAAAEAVAAVAAAVGVGYSNQRAPARRVVGGESRRPLALTCLSLDANDCRMKKRWNSTAAVVAGARQLLHASTSTPHDDTSWSTALRTTGRGRARSRPPRAPLAKQRHRHHHDVAHASSPQRSLMIHGDAILAGGRRQQGRRPPPPARPAVVRADVRVHFPRHRTNHQRRR